MNTALQRLKHLLASRPHDAVENVEIDANIAAESIRYLASDGASHSLEVSSYWPKWNSPWWHAALVYEMGMAHHIPKDSVRRLLAAVKREHLPLYFESNSPCPCSLGNIFQILSASGVDMDSELPWARAWFMRYQMPDGGISCDNDAYQANPPASSIVGTIAPLEAVLLFTHRPFTADESRFLDQGARFLMDRELRLGCTAEHNVEEQEDEQDWLRPCFPRFYFYDVLRGLAFILKRSEARQQPISAEALVHDVTSLNEKFPEGKIKTERHAYAGVGTRIRSQSGEWERFPLATPFPLLTQVSETGQVSPYLTNQ